LLSLAFLEKHTSLVGVTKIPAATGRNSSVLDQSMRLNEKSNVSC